MSMSAGMRPVYRWKSFWLGVLVLVFLGWAWVRSQEIYTYVGVTREGGWGVGIGQERGEISLTFHSVGDGGVYHIEGAETGEPRWWPRDAFRSAVSDSARFGIVAHWVVVLGFLVVWLGWMGWRWVRVRGERMDG